MPDDADPPIARIAARPSAGLVPAARLGDPPRFLLQRRRAQGLADRRLHRVELVIAGHLLDERAAVVLEDDEVAQQRQEAALLEDALGQRQPVDEHDDVGPAGVTVLRDRELVDGRPRVGARLIEVDHACLSPADGPFHRAVLDRHALHQHAVESSVARFQRRAFRPGQLPQRIVERFVRQFGVEAAQCAANGARQYHVRMTRAQGIA